MEERTEGIILRTRPLTETSLIVEWITPNFGRFSTVAKGARRAKSPFVGRIDLFFHAELSFQRSRRSDLHILREVQILNPHQQLRHDIALLHQCAYFAVLIEQGTERETPLPDLYALLLSYLAHLPAHDRIPEAMFWFEFQFLRLLGMQPDIDHPLLNQAFPDLAPLTRIERNDLNRRLRLAIANSLERLPRQRQAAIDAFLNK